MKKLILLVLFLFSLQVPGLAAQPIIKNKISQLAANFSLPDLNNKQVSLSDFKDKPVILLFWATWCPYCRQAIKTLNNMSAELKKTGLEVLLIDVGETAAKVESFIKYYNLTFRVLLDKDTQVSESYSILGVPTYIIIDRDSRIRYEGNSFPEKEYKSLVAG